MDGKLDQWMEDQINGGYGYILDEVADAEATEDELVEPACPYCDDDGCDDCAPYDDVPLDGDHDSTMTSIGWGTDEDYGFFEGNDADW